MEWVTVDCKDLTIVHALCSDRRGGLEQAFVNLSHCLLALNANVSLWLPDKASYADDVSTLTPRISFEPRGYYDVLSILKTRSWLKEHRPDLIITHNSRATAIMRSARLGLGIPQLAFSHSYKHKRMKGATQTVVLTEHMKAHFVAKGYDPKQLLVLPNMLMSVPDRQLHPAPVRKADVCLGFVGRFDPEKGISDLLQAVYQLRQQGHVSLSLKLAGAGALEPELKAQVRRLQLDEQVVFSGWVNDLDEWMRDVDLLVVPSLNETFGIAILDGFCHGKPVISTQVPGPQSLIETGVSGWLAEPDNPEDLARVLDLAIRQQDQWPQIASCAYDKAKAHHYQQMLPRIAEIVRGVIDR